MELLRFIHRWRYLDHVSIREISLRAGLARNTVRNYLSSRSAEPKFNLPDRASKLDRFAKMASQMLWQEVGTSQKAEANNQAIAR